MITEAQKKKYVANGGVNCPVCNSENIEGSHMEADAGGAWQEVYCSDCGENWQDVYRLVDVFQKD